MSAEEEVVVSEGGYFTLHYRDGKLVEKRRVMSRIGFIHPIYSEAEETVSDTTREPPGKPGRPKKT